LGFFSGLTLGFSLSSTLLFKARLLGCLFGFGSFIGLPLGSGSSFVG
jgi:hypothetical protein